LQLTKPFEHEAKLATTTRRQQEIITALDITKNQAASVLGDVEDSGNSVQEKIEHRRQGEQTAGIKV